MGVTLPAIDSALIDTLKFVYDRLQSENIEWVLIGSTAFVLQGLPWTPADIDIQTDEAVRFLSHTRNSLIA